MVDLITIIFAHGLLLLAAWRLMRRDDLDHDDSPTEVSPKPWLVNRSPQSPRDNGDA